MNIITPKKKKNSNEYYRKYTISSYLFWGKDVENVITKDEFINVFKVRF